MRLLIASGAALLLGALLGSLFGLVPPATATSVSDLVSRWLPIAGLTLGGLALGLILRAVFRR